MPRVRLRSRQSGGSRHADTLPGVLTTDPGPKARRTVAEMADNAVPIRFAVATSSSRAS
jgi:hypothetical protein